MIELVLLKLCAKGTCACCCIFTLYTKRSLDRKILQMGMLMYMYWVAVYKWFRLYLFLRPRNKLARAYTFLQLLQTARNTSQSVRQEFNVVWL